MPNGYFEFKQFVIKHDKCAMKVGTDGVLLGAWANGGRRILDIGTGSGLIALFMAQRFTDATVTAIDIEHGACVQAKENAEASAFSGRINVVESSLQDFKDERYDAIVCNPPFYTDTLKSRTAQRTMARSTETLPFSTLFRCAAELLSPCGEFSVIIPSQYRTEFDTEAAFAGLYPSRAYALRTVPHKPVSRYLLAYRKQRNESVEYKEKCLNDADGKRSEWYSRLTADFYLR